jgi:hypothetical protein
MRVADPHPDRNAIMTDENSQEHLPSIAFVGDSITADGSWADWFPDRKVHNLGVAGDTTDELVARLDSVVDADPDAVALLIGTNDLSTRKSVEHLVRNVEYLLVTLRRELPGLLWLLLMGLVLFWVYDDSPGQARSHSLVISAVPTLDKIARMSRLPVIRGLVDDLVKVLGDVRGAG